VLENRILELFHANNGIDVSASLRKSGKEPDARGEAPMNNPRSRISSGEKSSKYTVRTCPSGKSFKSSSICRSIAQTWAATISNSGSRRRPWKPRGLDAPRFVGPGASGSASPDHGVDYESSVSPDVYDLGFRKAFLDESQPLPGIEVLDDQRPTKIVDYLP
jgi:hypothetical protein